LKFFRVTITPCPLMKELLLTGSLVGFRVNSDGSLDLLVRAGSSLNTSRKPSYVSHVRWHRGFIEVRGRRCILRDVILSGLYIVGVKSSNGTISIIVAGRSESEVGKLVKLASPTSSKPPCITAVEPVDANSITIDGETLHIAKLLASSGYLEYPRSISLSEIATKLNIPKSTLTYRVRRALKRILEYVVSTMG